MSYCLITAEPTSATGRATSLIDKLDDAPASRAVSCRNIDIELARIADAAGAALRDADKVKNWAMADSRLII